jgi:hypothetical protein
MKWKEFLIDYRKIVFFVLLIFVSWLRVVPGTETSEYRGFPLIFLINGCVTEIVCYDNYVIWSNLIIDALILFLISCFMVEIWNMVRKR